MELHMDTDAPAARSQQKILIVDDTPANVDLLADLLVEHYDLIVATNGVDALKAAETQRPDLILLDVVMPEMDGYETCRRLKEDPVTRDIPIIFVTALDDEMDEKKGLELGASDYITRPLRPAIIHVRIRLHLENRRQRRELERLACTDLMTGLANRARFDEMLEMEWLRHRRQGQVLSLVMMDVDYFKKYNDHYGHCAGDDCLRGVARALLGGLRRPMDLLARYGGEEFVALLPQVDDQGVLHIAEKLRASVAALKLPHAQSDTAEHVTISLGCATMVPHASQQPRTLVEAADRMLYQAKAQGRNQVQGCRL